MITITLSQGEDKRDCYVPEDMAYEVLDRTIKALEEAYSPLNRKRN
jgi:uncharacterized SAM-dependent methyltransferase